MVAPTGVSHQEWHGASDEGQLLVAADLIERVAVASAAEADFAEGNAEPEIARRARPEGETAPA
jgi:hypothetical protein